MNEKPLERLNYYNGQRLEASDFKTEQDYHMRTRRWLNKSLYSAGIARGLEVRAVPPDTTNTTKEEPPRVAVSPGLALDNEGREIILLENATVEVCSYAGTNESTVVGNYLVIEYAEETIAYEKGGCAVRATGTSANKSTTNWGGPSRIQSQVKFSWVPFVPHPGSNQIVLAQVELAERCREVHQIDTGARRYIGAASAATVRQYALEGEREIAAIPVENNLPLIVAAKVCFHVRGRQPNSVTLYLKAEELSALHYTELAAHSHSLSVKGGTGEPNCSLEHQHIAGTYIAASTWTDSVGQHHSSDHEGHKLKARMGYVGKVRVNPPLVVINEPPLYEDDNHAAFFLIENAWGVHIGLNVQLPPPFNSINDIIIAPETDANNDNDILKHTQGKIEGGRHEHGISGNSGNSTGLTRPSLLHEHSITGSGTSGETGTYDPGQHAKRARVGKPPLTFVRNLQIAIDGVDRTDDIKAQIVDSVATNKEKWRAGLGDGTSGHPIANQAIEAVPIRLDFLKHVAFGEGQHIIEFSVGLTPEGEANGGKIHYNLYIE